MKTTTTEAHHYTTLAKMYFAPGTTARDVDGRMRDECYIPGRRLVGKQYILHNGRIYVQYIYQPLADPNAETLGDLRSCWENHDWVALRNAIPAERWRSLVAAEAAPAHVRM